MEMPGCPMNSRLNRIGDWESLARHANYNASELAESCGVSTRQLERFFQNSFHKSPHKWLHDLRMRRAVELLRDSAAVKEVAFLLCYKDATHFSHDFKLYFGIPPGKSVLTELQNVDPVQMSLFDKRCRLQTR